MKISLALIGLFFILGLAVYFFLSRSQFGEAPTAEDALRFEKLTNYDGKSKTFQNIVPDPKNGKVDLFTAFKEMLFGAEVRSPSAPFPSQNPDIQAFLAKDGVRLKWLWLGHSTFYANLEGRLILVDPVFATASPVSFMVKRFSKPLVELKDLPKPDIVLISHDHYDHLDASVMRELAKDAPQFLVPMGIGRRLTSWGIDPSKIREMNWHESFEDAGLKFISVPAQHFSGRSGTDKNETLWTGWIVEAKDFKLYYSGDTGYAGHFKDIGERYGPIDVAFIECGQYNVLWQYVHLLPDEVIQAVKDLKARAFTPMHWGMFVLAIHDWYEPIEKVSRMAERDGLTIWHPELGQLVTFEAMPPPEAWWRNHPDFVQAKAKGALQ